MRLFTGSTLKTGILAAAASAVAIALGALTASPANASSHVAGPVKTRVGACLPGFKQTNKDAKGSYKCVSEVVKCPKRPYGFHTLGMAYNQSTGRFEYFCRVPEG